ncbi:hypothetical protein JTY60_02445 [symbiont of Argiope bruennichi]|uniref:hypothetical protein n=1 Tax=symbiont of Argiope bruennichi TaxID=2810479 RepID=UPI003DA5E28A
MKKKKNDDKLYIEENDKFSYFPDDVIKNKFTKANYDDFVFTMSLPFGKINFLKTNNIFLSQNITILKNNNKKICLNLFFYYFFKGNSYLFENNAGNVLDLCYVLQNEDLMPVEWLFPQTYINKQII